MTEQSTSQTGADAAPDPTADEATGLLRRSIEGQAAIAQKVDVLQEQSVFMSQQVLQSLQQVNALLSGLAGREAALAKTLDGFKTGGPQKAMASVFHKLFRDLLNHVNQLDVILEQRESDEASDVERAWLETVGTLRSHFEAVLADWGCRAMEVTVGTSEFDPEVHESVDDDPGEVPESIPENTVVRLVRRGWKLQDHILQYPQVVVS